MLILIKSGDKAALHPKHLIKSEVMKSKVIISPQKNRDIKKVRGAKPYWKQNSKNFVVFNDPICPKCLTSTRNQKRFEQYI